MSTRLKLAFSTRPAQQWIDVAFGSPRRWGRRRVERRQFACVRCAASTSDPHHGNPRSIFGAGMRGDQDGDAGWGGDGVFPPEDFAAGARGAYGHVQTHGARMAGADCSPQSEAREARGHACPRRVASHAVGSVQGRQPPTDARAPRYADRVRHEPRARQCRRIRSSRGSLLGRVVVLDMVEHHESRA